MERIKLVPVLCQSLVCTWFSNQFLPLFFPSHPQVADSDDISRVLDIYEQCVDLFARGGHATAFISFFGTKVIGEFGMSCPIQAIAAAIAARCTDEMVAVLHLAEPLGPDVSLPGNVPSQQQLPVLKAFAQLCTAGVPDELAESLLSPTYDALLVRFGGCCPMSGWSGCAVVRELASVGGACRRLIGHCLDCASCALHRTITACLSRRDVMPIAGCPTHCGRM